MPPSDQSRLKGKIPENVLFPTGSKVRWFNSKRYGVILGVINYGCLGPYYVVREDNGVWEWPASVARQCLE